MFFLTMALTAAAPATEQTLAGKAFEKLASRTDAICPARKVRSITPGDLDYVQEGFEEHLSHRALTRLESANRAPQRCADSNGLSCQTTVTLETMDRVGMMKDFSSYICSHPNSR